MERCPNCRARFKGDAVCYRCGCDLAPLLRIEARAEALERIALRCLPWDLQAAELVAGRVLQLQKRPLALALQGFVRHLAVRGAAPNREDN